MKGNTLATLISTTGVIFISLYILLVAAGVMFGYMIGVDQRNKKVCSLEYGLYSPLESG